MDVMLVPDDILLDEVEVVGVRAGEIQERTQMSSVNLDIKTVKNLPVLLGETDLLKVIQLLPGVQSGTEGTSGFYVRGGGPDQNLILIDGVPVYNVSHLFGFFSVFNADAINNVQLIKGGISGRIRRAFVLGARCAHEGRQHERVEGRGSRGGHLVQTYRRRAFVEGSHVHVDFRPSDLSRRVDPAHHYGE